MRALHTARCQLLLLLCVLGSALRGCLALRHGVGVDVHHAHAAVARVGRDSPSLSSLCRFWMEKLRRNGTLSLRKPQTRAAPRQFYIQVPPTYCLLVAFLPRRSRIAGHTDTCQCVAPAPTPHASINTPPSLSPRSEHSPINTHTRHVSQALLRTCASRCAIVMVHNTLLTPACARPRSHLPGVKSVGMPSNLAPSCIFDGSARS